MSCDYYSLLTNVGAVKMAYAAANSIPVGLSEIALGDGGGSLPSHTEASTALVHEVYRAAINSITQSTLNPAQYIIELVVPSDIGGFWIREFRIDDDDGNPIYIGDTAPEYKPSVAEGMIRESIYQLVVETSNAATISLVVDQSAVLATHQFVLNEIANHEAKPNPHPQYILRVERGANNGVASLDEDGTVPLSQLPAAVATDSEVVAAIIAHKAEADPHPQYLLEAEMDSRLMSKRATRYYHANF